jgi:hypothetical protein
MPTIVDIQTARARRRVPSDACVTPPLARGDPDATTRSLQLKQRGAAPFEHTRTRERWQSTKLPNSNQMHAQGTSHLLFAFYQQNLTAGQVLLRKREAHPGATGLVMVEGKFMQLGLIGTQSGLPSRSSPEADLDRGAARPVRKSVIDQEFPGRRPEVSATFHLLAIPVFDHIGAEVTRPTTRPPSETHASNRSGLAAHR